MKLSFVASMALAGLAAFFAVQNSQVSRVSFLGWYFEAPLVMILLLTFSAGAVTAMLMLWPATLRKTLEIRRLRSELKSCQGAVKPPAGMAQSDSSPGSNKTDNPGGL